jgi:hypothetical protein
MSKWHQICILPNGNVDVEGVGEGVGIGVGDGAGVGRRQGYMKMENNGVSFTHFIRDNN